MPCLFLGVGNTIQPVTEDERGIETERADGGAQVRGEQKRIAVNGPRQ